MAPNIHPDLSAGMHAEDLIRRIHDWSAHRHAHPPPASIFREAEALAYETRDGMAEDLGVPAPLLKYWMRHGRFPNGRRMKGVMMRLRRRLVRLCWLQALGARLRSMDTPPSGVIWVGKGSSTEEKRSRKAHEAATKPSR